MDYIYVQYSVIGWGTLALINAAIAQGQGRSALLWLVLSLLFGPLATFFMVITYNRNP